MGSCGAAAPRRTWAAAAHGARRRSSKLSELVDTTISLISSRRAPPMPLPAPTSSRPSSHEDDDEEAGARPPWVSPPPSPPGLAAALGVATDDGARPVTPPKQKRRKQRVKEGTAASADGGAEAAGEAAAAATSELGKLIEASDATLAKVRAAIVHAVERADAEDVFDGVAAYANIEKLVELATKLNGALLAKARGGTMAEKKRVRLLAKQTRALDEALKSAAALEPDAADARLRAAAAILSKADAAAAAAAERAAAERAAAAVAAVAAAAASESPRARPPPPRRRRWRSSRSTAISRPGAAERRALLRVKLAIALRAKAAAAAGDARRSGRSSCSTCAPSSTTSSSAASRRSPTVDAAAPLRRVRARREAMEALRARADGTAAAAAAAAAPAPADEEEGVGLSMADLVQNVSVRSRRPSLARRPSILERRPSILGGPTARERRGSQPERKGSSWDRVRRGSFQVIGAVSAMRKMSMGAMAPASALTRRRRGSNAEALTESDVLLGRCNTVHEQVRDEVRRALDSKTVGAAPLDRALALLDGAAKLYEGARARMEEAAEGQATMKALQRVRGLIHQTGGMKWEVRAAADALLEKATTWSHLSDNRQRIALLLKSGGRFAGVAAAPAPSQAPPTRTPKPKPRARHGSLYLSAVVAAAARSRRPPAPAPAAAPAPEEELLVADLVEWVDFGRDLDLDDATLDTLEALGAGAVVEVEAALVSPTKVAAASAEVARAAGVRQKRRSGGKKKGPTARETCFAWRGLGAIYAVLVVVAAACVATSALAMRFDVETGTRWVLLAQATVAADVVAVQPLRLALATAVVRRRERRRERRQYV